MLKRPIKNALEYRLSDEKAGFPAIYHVVTENPAEIICRRNCEYLILNGGKFENVGGAMEEDRYVLYIKEVKGFFYPNYSFRKELGIEIRLFAEKGEQMEFSFIPCHSHLDLMLALDNTYFYFDKKEYERISAEFDQDRKVYVLYVKPTGVQEAK